MFPVIQKSKLFGAFHIWKGNDPAAGPLPAGRWCQRFGLLEEDIRTRLPRFGLPVRCVVFFIDYSRISPGGPRKPPGCCWRSSDPLLTRGFPSLIQLVCVRISWTMKKLMLLTGLDFNQAPHGPCVSRRGATQTVGSWPIFLIRGRRSPKRALSRQERGGQTCYWAVLRKFREVGSALGLIFLPALILRFFSGLMILVCTQCIVQKRHFLKRCRSYTCV